MTHLGVFCFGEWQAKVFAFHLVLVVLLGDALPETDTGTIQPPDGLDLSLFGTCLLIALLYQTMLHASNTRSAKVISHPSIVGVKCW